MELIQFLESTKIQTQRIKIPYNKPVVWNAESLRAPTSHTSTLGKMIDESKEPDLKILQEIEEQRVRELEGMLGPFLKVTDAYGELICALVNILGHNPPKDTRDKVVRDLLADVFDSLIESRRIALTGRSNIAFPIARRAYESLSLMVLCIFNEEIAKKWQNEKNIKNSCVRSELSKHPLGESKESTKELYDFFSLGAHPNRVLVSERHLGSGNQFVLGSIGKPSLVLVTEHCMKLLDMWFWFGAVIVFFYRGIWGSREKEMIDFYTCVSSDARKISKQLKQAYNKVLKEEKEILTRQRRGMPSSSAPQHPSL